MKTAVSHPRLQHILNASPTTHDQILHKPLALHQDLLAWFDHKPERVVPWRRAALSSAQRKSMSHAELSLYAYQIWVSEIMCQQTRLETAIPFYQRWMARFPNLEKLAEASVEDVREMWTGLGYYNRATRLLSGAHKIVKDFKGKVPSDPKTLQKEIPGIGPYTSAAITSIVYNAPVAAVDGNLQRVYCRVFGIHANLAAKATSDALQSLADRTMPRDRPGDYNQAVMDLGYSVCTPKNPLCEECPLSDRCVAYAQQKLAADARPVVPDIEEAALGECTLCAPHIPGSSAEVTRYPMAKVKKQSKEDDCAVCVLEWKPPSGQEQKHYLMTKRPEGGLLAGMWEMPSCEMEGGSSRSQRLDALQEALAEVLKGVDVDTKSSRSMEMVTHKFSHITRSYYPCFLSISTDALPRLRSTASQAKWVAKDAVGSTNIPGAIKTIWNEFQSGGRPAKRKSTATSAPAKKKAAQDASQKQISRFFTRPDGDAASTPKMLDSEARSEPRPNSVSPVEGSGKKRKVRVIEESEDSDT